MEEEFGIWTTLLDQGRLAELGYSFFLHTSPPAIERLQDEIDEEGCSAVFVILKNLEREDWSAWDDMLRRW